MLQTPQRSLNVTPAPPSQARVREALPLEPTTFDVPLDALPPEPILDALVEQLHRQSTEDEGPAEPIEWSPI